MKMNVDSLVILLVYEDKKLKLIPNQSVLIGRENADFIIPNSLVSRKHCKLTLAQDLSLEIIDQKSTNGTRFYTSKGELHTLKYKYTFRNLSEHRPLHLILADKEEIEFDYVNLKTQTITKNSKPINLVVKKPYELSLENITHISKILPSAAVAMVRKMLELSLKEYLKPKDKKIKLVDIIQQIENEHKKKFGDELIEKIKSIQTLGNKSLHEKTEVSIEAAKKAIENLKEVLEFIKDYGA